jgi:hypothetical protein
VNDDLDVVWMLWMEASFEFGMSAPVHCECERRLTLRLTGALSS